MSDFFKNPGDLSNDIGDSFVNVNSLTRIKTMDKKAITDYLLTIVSGKKYDYDCELGTLCGGGKMVVSLDRVLEMVELGYNIISARCINVNMIEVEFQQFRKNNLGKVR